jgi:hypothetical protein
LSQKQIGVIQYEVPEAGGGDVPVGGPHVGHPAGVKRGGRKEVTHLGGRVRVMVLESNYYGVKEKHLLC